LRAEASLTSQDVRNKHERYNDAQAFSRREQIERAIESCLGVTSSRSGAPPAARTHRRSTVALNIACWRLLGAARRLRGTEHRICTTFGRGSIVIDSIPQYW
jgi:hypothetical protein